MEFIAELTDYIVQNFDELLLLTGEHLLMVVYGIVIALLIGIPLGIIAAKFKKAAPVILSLVNVLQLTPSLAMLAILMLYFGFGFQTVVIALVLYSLLPIVKNTYVGIQEVDDSIVEAGTGIGMTKFQLLTKVEFPLSIPFIMAGLRLASVIAVSVATLGPYIGGGGLGEEIVSGISIQSDVQIFAGAIPATIMALLADFALGKLEAKTKRELV